MTNKPLSPHISASSQDFASTVLMPGDPLRSKMIAEKFLTNAKLVNNVRGVQGYTGSYLGKRVSVMGSGMGMPSIGIYSFELFNFSEVSSIIRVGSAGAIDPDLELFDIVLGQGACTDSNYFNSFGIHGSFAPIADYGLLSQAVAQCESSNYRYRVGNLLSSDVFYQAGGVEVTLKWREVGVLAVDSCLLLACQLEGSEIITIEGLAKEGELDELQEAFVSHGAIQCGYCTPGMVMATKALLMENPAPTEAEIRNAIAGNICRCSGYSQIVSAVLSVKGSPEDVEES